jgi:cell wall assembly regulator SMI1
MPELPIRRTEPDAPPDTATAWKRLEQVLAAASPEILQSLKPGATKAKLTRVEEALGVALPPEVRASYLLHDGQSEGADGLFPRGFAGLSSEFPLLLLDGALGQWRSWNEGVDGGEFDGATSAPVPGFRPHRWNAGWLPIASAGGDSLCVNLAPGENGLLGQVILFGRERFVPGWIAGSLTALLTRLAGYLGATMQRGASVLSTRDPTPAEEALIADVLRRLREHFHAWPTKEGHEHDLAAFAYYEGCARRDDCCRTILGEAAPFALGQELVARHGFRWVMIASGDTWRYGVAHPALRHPIDLLALEDGSWNNEEYDLGGGPDPGEMTHDSFDTIVKRVRE